MKNDGGAAFPVQGFNGIKHPKNDLEWQYSPKHPSQGMSLRDYFAGQALNALVVEALRLDHKSWDATAQHAYFIADAMIEARGEQ